MNTETKHTPGPWKTGPSWIVKTEDGNHICDCSMTYLISDHELEANAEFIVRACNSHYDLLEALEELLLTERRGLDSWEREAFDAARAAIKKATEQES